MNFETALWNILEQLWQLQLLRCEGIQTCSRLVFYFLISDRHTHTKNGLKLFQYGSSEGWVLPTSHHQAWQKLIAVLISIYRGILVSEPWPPLYAGQYLTSTAPLLAGNTSSCLCWGLQYDHEDRHRFIKCDLNKASLPQYQIFVLSPEIFRLSR